MTDASWDDYTAASDTTDELSTAATDEGLAATDDDWSSWNAATGDDATESAASYTEAANEASAGGDDEVAAQDYTDAAAQLDVASDSYSTAADYSSEADSYSTDADASVASAADSDE